MDDKNPEYFKYQLVNVINVHKLVTANYFEVGRNFQYKGEKHDFWEMVYVDKGELIVETDTETFTLGREECAIHQPGEFHIHKANGVLAPNYFVICFVCNSAYMDVFKKKRFNLTEKQKKFISNIIEEISHVFKISWSSTKEKRLEFSPNEPIGGQQLIKTYLEQLLILLIRQEHGTIDSLKGQPTEGENIAEKMKRTLDACAYKEFNVEEFCREMGYSKSYLSKIFIKEYGYTIHNYVTILKMWEAKSLIREHIYSFTQISDMLCYSNPLYFSKVFKKIMGMTPSEYKNSVTSG